MNTQFNSNVIWLQLEYKISTLAVVDLLGAPVIYYLPNLKPEKPNHFAYSSGSPECGGFLGAP